MTLRLIKALLVLSGAAIILFLFYDGAQLFWAIITGQDPRGDFPFHGLLGG